MSWLRGDALKQDFIYSDLVDALDEPIYDAGYPTDLDRIRKWIDSTLTQYISPISWDLTISRRDIS